MDSTTSFWAGRRKHRENTQATLERMLLLGRFAVGGPRQLGMFLPKLATPFVTRFLRLQYSRCEPTAVHLVSLCLEMHSECLYVRTRRSCSFRQYAGQLFFQNEKSGHSSSSSNVANLYITNPSSLRMLD